MKQQAQDAVDAQKEALKKALVEKAKEVTAEQQKSLEKILETAPEGVRSSLNDIIETVGDAYNRATAIFQSP